MSVSDRRFTAFLGERRLASGTAEGTLKACKAWLDRKLEGRLLIFDDGTGRQVDFDFRGSIDEVLARLADHPLFAPSTGGKSAPPAESLSKEGTPARRRGPGRPRLGVVSREVTLLPRHWDWLASQGKGISATLRRIVDEARKAEGATDDGRRAREACGTFLTSMAGNLPGYEEATRALWAKDGARFADLVSAWPEDLRDHALRLAGF